MQNIIICTTPLQMLIAHKIIKIKADESFDLLVIAQHDNEKYRYYFNRLKKDCKKSLYYTLKKGGLGFLDFVRKIYLNKFNKQYDNVYLSSIDSSYCVYILSKSKKARIYTFDDGTANISKSSIYYSKITHSLNKRLIFRLFDMNLSMDNIKANSSLHYTIYKNVPNIIDNTYYINLYDDEDFDNSYTSGKSLNDLKVINIFLGQPIGEVPSSYQEKDLIYLLENTLCINLYFPHPREITPPLGNYEVVETNLIFEDYIRIYLKENLNTKVNIYTFISSALLNLKGSDRVSMSYIYDPLLYNDHKEFYSMVDTYFKIPVIYL